MNARWPGLLLLCCGLAHAGDEPAERDQLRRDRQAIEARHGQREQTCRQQFVVTPCLEAARADKQKALQAVQARESALDDAQRRRRAEIQAQRVTDKARAAQAREESKALKEPRPPRVVAPKPVKTQSTKASQPDRSAAEKRQREAFDARQREIQAHREEVEKRNAARAARKPPVPLPVPASAAVR
jgi:colicin import membrane protein